jgi:hypothetical protein
MVQSLDGLAIVHLSFIAYFAILYLRIKVSLTTILFSAAASFAVGALGSALIARGYADDQNVDLRASRFPIKLERVDSPASISNRTVNAIKRAHRTQNQEGTIVRNTSTHNCVAIEFYGSTGLDGRSIEVQYVRARLSIRQKYSYRDRTIALSM